MFESRNYCYVCQVLKLFLFLRRVTCAMSGRQSQRALPGLGKAVVSHLKDDSRDFNRVNSLVSGLPQELEKKSVSRPVRL